VTGRRPVGLNFLIGFFRPAAYPVVAINKRKARVMDVIFNCPKCEQELAVDSTGAGTEINCPACNALIVIPAPELVVSRPGVDSGAPVARVEAHPINPIASSAAAKVEMHLRVPVHKTPTERLIEKPPPPLEAAAKESDKKVRVKTIRHTDCIEVGHDKFDEVVSNFLIKVGESNIISITTIVYTHLDIGTQKLLQDFGVMVVYRA
jgi:DNA-directed RNA polymerase subunit RPC12/RpoP